MATVLIVDDRAINREYLSSLLKYLNHTCIEAKNGLEALDIIQQQRPELIVSDILMPYMDGYEFVRQLKRLDDFKTIPIIFYTATYRKEEADLLAKDLGVQYVLSKPSDPQTMIDTILLALGIKKEQTLLTAELSQPQHDLKANLYQAPHQLIEIGGKLHHSLAQIKKIKHLLQSSLTAELSKEKIALIELADNLSNDILAYRKINNDLFLLIELTLEMIAEKDAVKLLQLFCHGTRKAVDAEFALACIVDENRKIRHLVTSGSKDFGFNENTVSLNTFADAIMKQGSAFTLNNIETYLIPWHQEKPSNMLCSPIFTNNQIYGFSYFINKKEYSTFNEEEIRMLDTLSSEVSIFYENIELYNLIQQQAAKLQIEGSKLKHAKEELHKSEMMFRQFAENIKDVFWRTSSNMDKVIYISPGYETIWGKTTESIYQDPCSWKDAIVEEDKLKVMTFMNKVIEREEGGSLEYRIKNADGIIRNIYNKTICLKDEEGQLQHIIGIASDITEYLQNQKEITLENELTQILEKNSPLTQIIPHILQLICKIFDWDIGEMWLVDEQQNVLQNMGIWHKKRKAFSHFDEVSLNMTLTINEDLPGTIWKCQEPRWFGNYSSHSAFKRGAILQQLGLHDAAGLPLMYQGKMLGVMHFFAKKISPFSPNFTRILILLGARISEYIHQKVTHEQLLQLLRRGTYRVIF
ncbi:MAG: hypothetical protein BGO43_00510 [Gammaproteobacteria bacterium 39-13]|nr:response regulator [Gammaproteobacteria bacterium]OJV96739.1 MAG: hypothetical protein BGO43_00510 [Gammaproteobacteria bacterium 39-13]